MPTLPSYAKPILEHLGFSVALIDVGVEESADWVAKFDDDVSLVEEKLKQHDPEDESRRKATLDAGLPFDTHTPLVPNNTLSGITGKAASQLLATSGKLFHDFRLVWLTATGPKHEAKFHQYIATLYGSTNLLERGRTPLRVCYFFRNSDFFRYKDVLDGAIVAETDGGSANLKLCINPLSPRYSRFKDSSTRGAFGTAVLDPYVHEASGGAFIVDCDIDRRREQPVLEWVQHKYSTDYLMSIDMGLSSVAIALPASNG